MQSQLPIAPEEEVVAASNPSRKRPRSAHDAETCGSGLSSSLPSSSKKVKVDNTGNAPQHEHPKLLPVPSTPISNPVILNGEVGNRDDDQTLLYTSPRLDSPHLTQSESPVGILTTVTITITTLDGSKDRIEPTTSCSILRTQLKLECMQSFKVDQNDTIYS